MADITALDYILLPFYLIIIFKIAYNVRNKYYPENHPFKPYFIPALIAKIAGSIFIGLIYAYYYNGGDTFNFFFVTKLINSTFIDTPDSWFRLITHNINENNITDQKIVSSMFWYDDTPSYTTACIGAIIGLFCFTKYLIINSIIAVISFIGSWLMFIAFAKQYKSITMYIAIAILFMPGPLVWGSGLFKDSFCMFSIGCLVYIFYVLFEERRFKFSLVILCLTAVTLLLLIKAYILVVLLPTLVIKTILSFKKKAIEQKKQLMFYFVLFIFYLIVSFAIQRAASYLSTFSTASVLQTVKKQKDYLLNKSLDEDGSAYDLGDFEPSVKGIAKMIVPAINVALFRPYPWESKSIVQLFNSLESTTVLLLTLFLLVRRNIFITINNIYKDPNLIMCLFFSLLFAFIVGVSSYNFGSLSRYKIPCTPFYMLFLMILIFNNQTKDPVTPAIDHQ
ncbi:hypothetical protein [Mucilaginibacter sp. UYCu711]|uniref:hypothetical protein n=1 Tax=Mucilaginibacter sp. UYCu711 TaxID=3156339 RepID=UPI003D1DD5D5